MTAVVRRDVRNRIIGAEARQGSRSEGLYSRAMTDEPTATGVLDAILIDTLLGFVRPRELTSLSAEERLELLRTAAADGRIPPDHVERLRNVGLLPPSPSPP
jgi:hypothetical protein